MVRKVSPGSVDNCDYLHCVALLPLRTVCDCMLQQTHCSLNRICILTQEPDFLLDTASPTNEHITPSPRPVNPTDNKARQQISTRNPSHKPVSHSSARCTCWIPQQPVFCAYSVDPHSQLHNVSGCERCGGGS